MFLTFIRYSAKKSLADGKIFSKTHEMLSLGIAKQSWVGWIPLML